MQDIFDALRESAKRLKADGKEVAELIDAMARDLESIESDLSLNPSAKVRNFLLIELDSIQHDRPKHILAAVEAKAGAEVAKLFEEGLSIAINIAVKVLLRI